eukprot:scaffold536030_cov12-Prasinocladus_malaysianus.AAC.1
MLASWKGRIQLDHRPWHFGQTGWQKTGKKQQQRKCDIDTSSTGSNVKSLRYFPMEMLSKSMLSTGRIVKK